MDSILTPGRILSAAFAFCLVGIAGLLAGELKFSPLGLLAGELLIIYAAILWTTPTIPPLSTRPPAVTTTTPEQPLAGEAPVERVVAVDEAAPSGNGHQSPEAQ